MTAAGPPTAAAAALGPDGLRGDGRSPSHIRPLTCERSLLPRADGSARWTAGGTSALAAVYGPSSTSARVEDPERAVVRASWRAAPVVGTAGPPAATPAARALEAILAGMVRAALLAEAAPRTAISIDVTIEADDGGAAAAGLNAAAAALADAGGCLPLRALPAAGSVVVAGDGTLLADPTAAEEADCSGTATFAFLTRSTAPGAPPALVGGGGLAGASVSGALSDDQVLGATALAGGAALAAAGFNRAGLARSLAPPAATRLALRLMLHAAKENAPLSTSAAAMASAKALSAPASAAPLPALRVKKLNPDAVLPKRGSSGAAGYDLASCADVTVPAHGRAIVPTGLALAAPAGTYARVAPRSGLAVKHFIDTGAGVVDEDYRGEVGVVLFNHGDAAFEVKRGDRVAQLILERIITPDVEEVEDLDDTARGAGGYGSTGVASK